MHDINTAPLTLSAIIKRMRDEGLRQVVYNLETSSKVLHKGI